MEFDSSGEPTVCPGDAFVFVAGGSGSEFDVGCATSCDEVPSLVQSPPMGCASFVTIFHIALAMFGTFVYAWCFIDVSEGATISSGCHNIPTEAERRSHFRRQRAVVTRRLVPLAGNVRVPLASASGERSRELLEKAFDIGMYIFR